MKEREGVVPCSFDRVQKALEENPDLTTYQAIDIIKKTIVEKLYGKPVPERTEAQEETRD